MRLYDKPEQRKRLPDRVLVHYWWNGERWMMRLPHWVEARAFCPSPDEMFRDDWELVEEPYKLVSPINYPVLHFLEDQYPLIRNLKDDHKRLVKLAKAVARLRDEVGFGDDKLEEDVLSALKSVGL